MNLTPHSRRCFVPLPLSWSHAGTPYRVTPWPDVHFERRYGSEWVRATPSTEASVSAKPSGGGWRAYAEFLPLEVRELLGFFRSNRLAALEVAARCPELVGALIETPALTPFVASHVALRESETKRWSELNSVFERGGVYALLEWLGLPATKQTLAILNNLVAPDLASSLLVPLRALLWRPQGIFALAQLPVITDQDLSDACALAA
jgi:hypothetical protein